MRKAVFLIISLTCFGILVLSMDQSFINQLKQNRYFDHLYPTSAERKTVYQKIFLRSDKWRYGDLYGISFLPAFKLKLEPFKRYTRSGPRVLTNNVLYIVGDSFLADKTLSGAFAGFDTVIFLDRRFPIAPIKLDSSKQNYLVMEFVEMNLVGYSPYITGERNLFLKYSKTGVNNDSLNANSPSAQSDHRSFLTRINDILFNKDLNRNIQLLLFDDKIFTPFKEAKAYLNYNLLGRLPTEVAISTDRKRLLINSTVDTINKTSVFRTISESSVDSINNSLTNTAEYYRSLGFKKVFLSVIPNAVTIYDPRRMRYNRLLQRVELKTFLPLISVYNEFAANKNNLYYQSDVHWNPAGLDLWVIQARAVFSNLR